MRVFFRALHIANVRATRFSQPVRCESDTVRVRWATAICVQCELRDRQGAVIRWCTMEFAHDWDVWHGVYA